MGKQILCWLENHLPGLKKKFLSHRQQTLKNVQNPKNFEFVFAYNFYPEFVFWNQNKILRFLFSHKDIVSGKKFGSTFYKF
jgi:hypothetical protein